MRKLKPILSVLLLALTLTACSTQTKTIYAKPECQPPPRPVLPAIDAQVLYDAVGQDVYEKLLRSNWKRDAYAEEMRAMLGVLCGPTLVD